MDNQTLLQKIEDLQNQIDQLRAEKNNDIRYHNHDGVVAWATAFNDLIGDIVSYTSTTEITDSIPKNVGEQIKLYVNGGTYRLYIYDFYNGAGWRYVALT